MRPPRRSAAAAAVASGAGAGFIGFEAFAAGGSAAPTPGSSGESPRPAANEIGSFYQGSDGDVAMALKKAGKKDSTTKVKALDALESLFTDRESVVLRDALPHAAQLYSQLCLHNERRVRAGAQRVLSILVRAAALRRPGGRVAGPHP